VETLRIAKTSTVGLADDLNGCKRVRATLQVLPHETVIRKLSTCCRCHWPFFTFIIFLFVAYDRHPRRGFTSFSHCHNKNVNVSPQIPILENARNLWELVKPSIWDHFLAHLREDFRKFPLRLSPMDKTQGKIALEEKIWQKSAVSFSRWFRWNHVLPITMAKGQFPHWQNE